MTDTMNTISAIASGVAALVAAIAAYQAKRATDQAAIAAQAAVDLTTIERDRLAEDRLDRMSSTGFRAWIDSPPHRTGRRSPFAGQRSVIRLLNLGPGTVELVGISLSIADTQQPIDIDESAEIPRFLDPTDVVTIIAPDDPGLLDMFVEWTDARGRHGVTVPVKPDLLLP